MELTKQKSEELAALIEAIKLPIFLIDVDYAKAVAKSMHEQAHRQLSLSVLNPSYNLTKNDLIATQANALMKLVEYIELLKKCDAYKQSIKSEEQARNEINRFFL